MFCCFCFVFGSFHLFCLVLCCFCVVFSSVACCSLRSAACCLIWFSIWLDDSKPQHERQAQQQRDKGSEAEQKKITENGDECKYFHMDLVQDASSDTYSVAYQSDVAVSLFSRFHL